MKMKLRILLLSMLVLTASENARAGLYTEDFNSGGSVGTIPSGNPTGSTFTGNFNAAPVGAAVITLTISFTISGGYNGFLYGNLVAPNGTSVELLNQPGASQGVNGGFGYGGSGFDVTLSDSASTSIQNAPEADGAQFSGTYQASGTLANFTGSSANGNWQLFFAYSDSGGNGTLSGWSLGIEAVPEPVNAALGIFGALIGIAMIRRHVGQFFSSVYRKNRKE